jgi:hypothetical protein
MVPVRALSCQSESDQCHDAGSCIRQVVEGVGGDGYGMGQKSGGEFTCKEKEIEKNTDCPREDAVAAPHLGKVGIFVIRDKKSG